MWFDRSGVRPTELGKQGFNEPLEERCLDAIGERLHREALRLAARYPAAGSRMTVPSPELRFWAKCSRSTWLTVVAALIIGALLWQVDREQDQTAGDRSLAASSPAEHAARVLLDATVTVRVQNPPEDDPTICLPSELGF
jgi:hypothetical protein